MSTLVITLPTQAASEHLSLHCVLTPDGVQATHHAQLRPAELPAWRAQHAAARDVVVVVPITALSWQRLELPAQYKRSSERLRALVVGSLEESVLDETDDLHFALMPNPSAGQAAWVAVCQRQWLRGHMDQLAAVQAQAHRIVPQLSPLSTPLQPSGAPSASSDSQAELARPSELWAFESHGSLLWALRSSRTQGLPLVCTLQTAQALQWISGDTDSLTVYALPEVAAAAQKSIEQLGWTRDVKLLSAQEWALQSLSSPWDLSQFEFSATGVERGLQRLRQRWIGFRQAPELRWLRRGVWACLIVLAASSLLWRWQAQSHLSQLRAAQNQVLKDTFPAVTLVRDAPLQMSREVQQLRHQKGQLGPDDFELLLGQAGQLMGDASTDTPSQIEFTQKSPGQGVLRIQGLQSTPSAAKTAHLRAQGVAFQHTGSAWVLQAAAPNAVDARPAASLP